MNRQRRELDGTLRFGTDKYPQIRTPRLAPQSLQILTAPLGFAAPSQESQHRDKRLTKGVGLSAVTCLCQVAIANKQNCDFKFFTHSYALRLLESPSNVECPCCLINRLPAISLVFIKKCIKKIDRSINENVLQRGNATTRWTGEKV